MAFSRAEALLIASRGRATSISFFFTFASSPLARGGSFSGGEVLIIFFSAIFRSLFILSVHSVCRFRRAFLARPRCQCALALRAADNQYLSTAQDPWLGDPLGSFCL